MPWTVRLNELDSLGTGKWTVVPSVEIVDLWSFKTFRTFNTQYDDYFITRIHNTSQTNSKYWGILLGYQFIQVGGCQQRVQTGDDLLFAFDAFNKAHFLRLEGSQRKVALGARILVKVTDGSTGLPVMGARVADQLTDINGSAQIVFKSLGIQKIRAERFDSLRSNSLDITVG